MPAHYVHLSKRHMEERVRKDANLDPIGAAVKQDPRAAMRDFAAELGAAFRDELRRGRDRDDVGSGVQS
jgi:hypothetical protein